MPIRHTTRVPDANKPEGWIHKAEEVGLESTNVAQSRGIVVDCSVNYDEVSFKKTEDRIEAIGSMAKSIRISKGPLIWFIVLMVCQLGLTVGMFLWFMKTSEEVVKHVERFGTDVLVIVKQDLTDLRMQAITNGTIEETKKMLRRPQRPAK